MNEGNAMVIARSLYGLMLRARDGVEGTDDIPPEQETGDRASFVLATPIARVRVDVTEIEG